MGGGGGGRAFAKHWTFTFGAVLIRRRLRFHPLWIFVYNRVGESRQQIECKCTVCTVAPVLAQLWFVCSFSYCWKGKGLSGRIIRVCLFSVDTDEVRGVKRKISLGWSGYLFLWSVMLWEFSLQWKQCGPPQNVEDGIWDKKFNWGLSLFISKVSMLCRIS